MNSITVPTEGGAVLAAVIPMSELYPSPSNPRKHFEGLTDLTQSIQRKGIDVPLLVRERPTAKGRFEIVDGERRYRAAQNAGLQFVPVIQRNTLTDAGVLELQLENAIQRSDLTPLEEARGFKALLKASKATPAELAKRVSRSERWVADRLRLLDLIPALQQLLDQGRITIAHAEVLSKLKPDDQTRAADPGDGAHFRPTYGGLWAGREGGLSFDRSDDDAAPDARTADPYAGLKTATVKELEAWIARHVRLDVSHLATTAPLEFGRLSTQLAAAEAKTGRGKKVVHITHEYHLADEVKTEGRIYGPRSWRRADGTVGTVLDARGRRADAPTCEHSVLGLVVAGPEYGTAFQVCLAREACQTHWKAEIAEKKKRDKLRASGQGAAADAREASERKTEAEQRKAADAKRIAFNAQYRQAYPAIRDALTAAAPSADPVALLWFALDMGTKRPASVVTVGDLVGHCVGTELERRAPDKSNSSWTNYRYEFEDLEPLAKVLGVDLAPIMKRAAAALTPAAPATDAKATPAKKRARAKAAKAR
jgi:ParB family chromosome partitioning protein